MSVGSLKADTPIVLPKSFANAKQAGIDRDFRAVSHSGTKAEVRDVTGSEVRDVTGSEVRDVTGSESLDVTGSESDDVTGAESRDGPEVGGRGDTNARSCIANEAASARAPSCHTQFVAETEVRGDSDLETVSEPRNNSTLCAENSLSGAYNAAALSGLKGESDHLACIAQENESVCGTERAGRRSSMAMELITSGIQFKLDTVVDHSHEAVELAAKLELAMLMLASTESKLENAMIQIGQLQAKLQQHVGTLEQTETQGSVEGQPQKAVSYSTETDGIAVT